MEGRVIYELVYEETFRRDLKTLAAGFKALLKRRLEWLAENAQSVGHVPLLDPRFAGLYRFRIGDYRVLYRLDHHCARIYIVGVGHRRDVYS